MGDPTDRLIESTRRRLATVTLGLVTLLVVATGVATAFAGLRALDSDVDRALQATAASAVSRLEGGGPIPQGGADREDTPASSDTFLLYLDPSGVVVANPSRVPLTGLPDAAATRAAAASGGDLRTVDAGGTQVRLLTLPVVRSGEGAGETPEAGAAATSSAAQGAGGTEAPEPSSAGSSAGSSTGSPAAPENEAAGATPAGPTVAFVQVGFVLTLHDRQSASLVATIAVVGLVGLLGAGIVTLLVTGRALVPIRRTFDAQQRFVADASHELRTPAAVIRSTAEVLDREGLVAPDGRPLVEDIIAESDRLGRLVSDLLALASAEAAPLVLQRTRVDVAQLVRDTLRRTEPLAAGRAIRLAHDGPAQAFVAGDPDRLVQLLLILLDNALDHSPDGATVTVGIRALGRSIELDVDDEGPGIPAGDRERIFEPFARIPGVRRERSGGTGLGLAIARRIVSAHGGTIVAGESPTGGARFGVTLPSAAGATATT